MGDGMSRAKALFLWATLLLVSGFAIRYNAQSLSSRYYDAPSGRERYAHGETIKLYQEIGFAVTAIAVLMFPVAAHHWCSKASVSPAETSQVGE